jgi:hypothetical protein
MFTIKRGDTHRAIESELYEADGTPVILAEGDVVKWYMRPKNGGSIKIDGAPADGTSGTNKVRYVFEAPDVDAVDVYNGEWEVTFVNGRVGIYPGGKGAYEEVEITNSLRG